jgi:hypothetical protein
MQRYKKNVKIPRFPLINFKKSYLLKKKNENRRDNDDIEWFKY